jgi:predicted AAA+ superfamily ATPase
MAMTAQEALERAKDLNFEKVWAMFAESDRKFVEATEQIKARQAKTDEQLSRLEKTVDRVTGNVGGLNVSMGELVETLIAPQLCEKFEAWNYNLKRIFHRVYIYDDASIQRGEIDILLSNTTVCMAVEVKRWLEKTEQVDEHIKRMQLIRKYPPAETRGKRLLGAIAGAVVTPEAREYAEKNGFFVLELTGEDVRLLESVKDFQPKEW